MKNVKKMVAAALITMFAVSAAGCNMITKTDKAIKNSPVAKFGNVTITKADLDKNMEYYDQLFKSQYGDNYKSNSEAKQYYDQQRQQVLDSMVTEKVVLNKASEKKITATEDEITKKIDEFKKTYTEDQIKQEYSGGYGDPKFKEYAKSSVIITKLMDEITKSVKVEDKEMKDYYTNNQLSFTEKPNTIHVAHILSKTEEDAKKVKARLDKGEDFAKVAKEVSTEDAAKTTGGDLGTYTYNGSSGAFTDESGNQLDQTFMTAALALKDGQISNPVQTSFGWHVIKTIKKQEYKVKSFDSAKAEIEKTLLSNKKNTEVNNQISKWKEAAKVKYYEKNM